MINNTQERQDAVTTWMKKCQLDTNDPKWSSWLLDRFFEQLTSTPGGSLQDVYQGLDAALQTDFVELTKPVANLIKDLVLQGFTQYRSEYDEVDWSWANEELSHGASPARCYFFLLALPPEIATPQSVASIYLGLRGTLYQKEAEDTLSDDLERPEIQSILASQ
jgi:hypothetical protein